MTVALLTIRLYAPWVHSLKEKRMEVKSLLAKLRNKFNVSAMETDAQDSHQTIVIAVAALAAHHAQADSILESLFRIFLLPCFLQIFDAFWARRTPLG